VRGFRARRRGPVRVWRAPRRTRSKASSRWRHRGDRRDAWMARQAARGRARSLLPPILYCLMPAPPVRGPASDANVPRRRLSGPLGLGRRSGRAEAGQVTRRWCWSPPRCSRHATSRPRTTRGVLVVQRGQLLGGQPGAAQRCPRGEFGAVTPPCAGPPSCACTRRPC